jgi:hypothetical protein
MSTRKPAPQLAAVQPLLKEPAQTRELLYGKRFLAADRAQVNTAEIATWDKYLLREQRLLVPIDVQALYVPPSGPGSTEPMVRLPMLLAGVDGKTVTDADAGMPPLFAPGQPRPAGVHLHWAMPDALLRGRLSDSAGANKLGLPPLPDRWLVLRIVLPADGRQAITTGWVLEADRAVAVPLGSWSEGGSASGAAQAMGAALTRPQLTGTAGGGVAWAGVYDAVLNRFAFHDPLTDLNTLAPKGADENCASYLVAGWWSDPRLDPLDGARSSDSLDELLERLRWHPLYEWGDTSWELARQKEEFELKKALGLTTQDAWASPRPLNIPKPVKKSARPGAAADAATAASAAAAAAKVSTAAYAPLNKTLATVQKQTVSSVFAADAARHVAALPWHLRASLLHGVIYGVPVKGGVLVDHRPAAGALSLAVGLHDDDLICAFAAQGASPDQQRATERLLTAFTAQKVNRLASPDGLVELEEYEHAAGYASLPAGSAGNDRFIQRVQTGGVGGLNLGRSSGKATANKTVTNFASAQPEPLGPRTRHAHPLAAAAPAHAASAPNPGSNSASVLFSVGGKPALMKASTAVINEIAASRVGSVLQPTEARVVDRPAPRWTFATEPLIGIRGSHRSLRHGEDGRGSADGKLTCRWPTHVIQELPGLIAKDRFVTSLSNGGLPEETLRLAREAVLHDPYHDEWVARAVAPPNTDSTAVFNRLRAETLLRYGVDGTYDGATTAFQAKLPRSAAERRQAARAPARSQAGVVQQQRLVADEMRKYSAYKGADPDPVGVTTWSQPWVPMWLEWQVRVAGIDPPTLDAWRLQTLDLEPANATSASISGDSVVFSGRSQITTGAARTLSSAIQDWLKAEDALDAVNAGLVDDNTENDYRELDDAVQHLDVVSAALDGLRAQLLGFEARDGLRRPSDGAGGTQAPAPVRAPRALVAGTMVLERARLLDIFGRTLEVPAERLKTLAAPSRTQLDDDTATLGLAPRLLRPARWLLRWVEAGTPVGAEGTEARVDQIEAALMVNPVAGFLLPDHLDESLEVFAIDGSPVGELLHEAVSGGVAWEIAAGRAGPADAGPHFGLQVSQLALAEFAAGLVAADSAARGGLPLAAAQANAAGAGPAATAPQESALSALLRAIDTTLWTVDSFAALGSEHVAGLVGRPIAVVRAQLRLELMPPTDVDLSDPTRAEEWQAATAYAQQHAFAVRIGEVTRSDDGVLGFFVNDDYAHFRLVDKVIAATAANAGRSRGKLELLGSNTGKPAQSAIQHPYIAGRDEDDTLALHIGQTVTLTILMHPAGKCTLTSGILPRKALALARDWVGPGLAKIAPSLRTGPVLVETDLDVEGQVRLPKVSVFGKNQNFLWRDTPATWRTDAILAATQTALLPDTPAELREGWIRVAPEAPADPNAPGVPVS